MVEDFGTPHNRVNLGWSDALGLYEEGKRTLVLAEHKSAVRHSTEEGNSCPNYWHFSPYGFCPYGCAYCYLAGTQGVRFSPTVKVFLNLPEILAEVDRVARQLDEPTAFYLGKLQDGLALDPLTGYSRHIIPFFAAHPTARMTLLTKSADVGNLLDLDHRGHSILSWTVNPDVIIDSFEKNTPPLEKTDLGNGSCRASGLPPFEPWSCQLSRFPVGRRSMVSFSRTCCLASDFSESRLESICSYPQAMRLTEQILGPENSISSQLDRRQSRMSDGRARFPQELREKVYRYLLQVIRKTNANVEIGLCLEEPSMFELLNMGDSMGRCNCVL